MHTVRGLPSGVLSTIGTVKVYKNVITTALDQWMAQH